MTKNKIDPEAITIEHIRIIQSNITTEKPFRDNPQKIDQFEITNTQNSAFNFEEKRIRIRLNTCVKGLNENQEELGVSGDFVIEFHLYIDNFNDFVTEEKGGKRVSDSLGSTLVGIIYSTSRGIIYEKIQGTDLSGCILPVINPHSLITDTD